MRAFARTYSTKRECSVKEAEYFVVMPEFRLKKYFRKWFFYIVIFLKNSR